jgi:hypothetical protein
MARKKLQGTRLFLKEDFSSDTSKFRSSVMPIMKAARADKKKAFLKGNAMILDGKLYNRHNLDTLPESLNPRSFSCRIDAEGYAFYGKDNDLSNFHESPFKLNGITYNCVEQYIQYQKATHFNDILSANKILKEMNPSKQKYMGKRINNFDENRWVESCESYMMSGLLAKFSQNPSCLDTLTSTGHRYLYEASPYDKFWGTGASLNNKNCLNRSEHSGLNLLGKLLENVRERLCYPQ